MTNEELKPRLTELFPSAAFDESGEFLNAFISADEFLSGMKKLNSILDFDFDYLFCLTCVDWKDHLEMVYHLNSKQQQHTIVIKVKLTDIVSPKIESISGIWKTAELLEDEVYDLFGVEFLNHPNLRRIFLEEDWQGYPLRKNYSDENMVKL